MPVVALVGGAVRREGALPLIVFSNAGHAAALAVGEIVDVVESALDIQSVAGRPDLLGSAIVRGRATEIVDVAALLPWLTEAAPQAAPPSGTLLLVDDNPFFRDMLAPVLKAAGYRVRTAASAAEASRILSSTSVAAVVADLDLTGASGLDLVDAMRAGARNRDALAVLLASAASPDAIERARGLGVHDIVSKFDRSGLLAALSEAGREMELAA